MASTAVVRLADLELIALRRSTVRDKFSPATEEADLHGNLLTELPPLPARLTRLVLSDNRFEAVPAALRAPQAAHLQRLCLCNNRLTSLEGLLGSSLPRLEHANLAFNRIAALPPPGALSAPRLLSLGLAHNQLLELGPALAALQALPTLQLLSLQGNPCALRRDYTPATRAALPALRHLDLRPLDPRPASSTGSPPGTAPDPPPAAAPPVAAAGAGAKGKDAPAGGGAKAAAGNKAPPRSNSTADRPGSAGRVDAQEAAEEAALERGEVVLKLGLAKLSLCPAAPSSRASIAGTPPGAAAAEVGTGTAKRPATAEKPPGSPKGKKEAPAAGAPAPERYYVELRGPTGTTLATPLLAAGPAAGGAAAGPAAQKAAAQGKGAAGPKLPKEQWGLTWVLLPSVETRDWLWRGALLRLARVAPQGADAEVIAEGRVQLASLLEPPAGPSGCRVSVEVALKALPPLRGPTGALLPLPAPEEEPQPQVASLQVLASVNQAQSLWVPAMDA